MDYIYLGIGAVIGFHALTYAYWLKNNGNTLGAIGIGILVMTGLALTLLRMFKGN
ncbi:hypothetical protein SOV_27290 [Sporomusa ovata DSM 2662]|uniref:Uncharacterized protein n=1 Tax=Sporomusa ovata TaxID=2378 RepID=A0A0U1L4M4_9FIRM|nr:hypothetical protein [Sporomusa ovata]EQB26044.1 hypothetical protein SOV_4c07110 [Sporomusa ovata DSM 2662]CQR74620.1 hypothetical protein SpAn4DRAFT_1082 [Sporomusa ovata]